MVQVSCVETDLLPINTQQWLSSAKNLLEHDACCFIDNAPTWTPTVYSNRKNLHVYS